LICSLCFPTDANLKKYGINSFECELHDIQKKWIVLVKENNLIHYNLIDFLFSIQNNSFLKKSSSLDCSKNPFLNDDNGPIIVDEDVTIMEGAMIRGPVHICKGSVIKMGAKIYGPTVIGPYCKIGGEISNCIFLGYSNKAHEGFLGHSIIGEWCNIGAGTSNSNLKNNYDTVKIWNYSEKKFEDSAQQFLGMYMGDHSKCAINTSFNTGTTIGVNCNIFGAGFPRNYIPSFSWGGSSGYKEHNIDKAIETAKIVMNRRNINTSTEYEKMLRKVFSMTADFRS
jgi:UDP-N-acetylglucosamine diphosphorylase/glucosamine-1-phosphate N-acetyltransferase